MVSSAVVVVVIVVVVAEVVVAAVVMAEYEFVRFGGEFGGIPPLILYPHLSLAEVCRKKLSALCAQNYFNSFFEYQHLQSSFQCCWRKG